MRPVAALDETGAGLCFGCRKHDRTLPFRFDGFRNSRYAPAQMPGRMQEAFKVPQWPPIYIPAGDQIDDALPLIGRVLGRVSTSIAATRE